MSTRDQGRETTLIDGPPVAGARLRPGPNGLPRRAVSDIQRGRILTAAVQTVEDVGYSRMTVAQVIQRARVSRKTFYLVFDDREDCFLAAFDLAIARASEPVAEAFQSEETWRDCIRCALARLLALLDDEPGLARLCIVEALGAGPRVLERRCQVLGRIAAAIDGGRRVAPAPELPLSAEGVVAAVLGVLHARLLKIDGERLSELLNPLMSMIVLPYLGPEEARIELDRRPPELVPCGPLVATVRSQGPLDGLDMRLTYRTVRVLVALAENPGASNREIAKRADIVDQGQISKLLTRLSRLGLVTNVGEGQERGMSNAWHLTDRGVQVERATRLR